ncbi:IS110 family transposase [Pseudonocardia benzenivorans]|jgi:transposase
MTVFVGDDWAEEHHDVELLDDTGRRLGRARLPEGMGGMTRLHEMLAEHLDDTDVDSETGMLAAGAVVVGIETDRGPWVAALVAAGYEVFAINPLSAARYRERHSTSGAKSDPGDAHVLAEIVRLDRAHHRPVAGDSAQVEGLKMIARTHQSLVWDRTRHAQRLRQALREYFPAALDAIAAGRLELADPDALELLERAGGPDRAARLSRSKIAAILKKSRRRDVDARAEQIQTALRAPALRQPPALESAYAVVAGTQIRLLLGIIAQLPALEEVLGEGFGRHPDAEIYTSQPGLGVILGARVLAEFGDDPHRYRDAKSRKNYAGTSPITRASGRRTVVLARYARNKRLGDAVHQWAFCALTNSPGARAYYDELRSRKVGHHAALRQLGNRLVGILHGCLKTRTTYNETTAWAHRFTAAA